MINYSMKQFSTDPNERVMGSLNRESDRSMRDVKNSQQWRMRKLVNDTLVELERGYGVASELDAKNHKRSYSANMPPLRGEVPHTKNQGPNVMEGRTTKTHALDASNGSILNIPCYPLKPGYQEVKREFVHDNYRNHHSQFPLISQPQNTYAHYSVPSKVLSQYYTPIPVQYPLYSLIPSQYTLYSLIPSLSSLNTLIPLFMLTLQTSKSVQNLTPSCSSNNFKDTAKRFPSISLPTILRAPSLPVLAPMYQHDTNTNVFDASIDNRERDQARLRHVKDTVEHRMHGVPRSIQETGPRSILQSEIDRKRSVPSCGFVSRQSLENTFKTVVTSPYNAMATYSNPPVVSPHHKHSPTSTSSPDSRRQTSISQLTTTPIRKSDSSSTPSAPNSFTANTFSPVRCQNSSTSTLIYHNNNYPIHQLLSNTIPLELTRELQNSIYPSIDIKKYSTSAIDPVRNFLTVYEYPIFNHWVIWDYETGFVHLTGIWKASLSTNHLPVTPSFLSHKADIVKLLDSTPKQYHQYFKRIRGGFLKIQGTWLPYKLCRLLARRFCYYIRHELIPIFGVDFPSFCLKPTDRGFGELKLDEIPNEVQYSTMVPPYSENTELVVTPVQAPRKKRLCEEVGPLDKRKRLSIDEYTGKFDSAVASKFEYKLKPNFQLIRWSQEASAPPVFVDSPLITRKRASSPMVATHDINDMIEIVNASKCLQSLSKSSQSSPLNTSISGTDFASSNPRTDSTSSDISDPFNHYTISSAPRISYPLEPSGGISSILVAAGLSDPPSLPTHISSDKTPYRRSSMNINDLLT
jgi:hypothetical protein